MVNDVPSVRALFEQALERASDAERAAFLDVACAGQTELRSNIESLLRAHAAAGSFLDHPAWDTQTGALSTAPEGLGISANVPPVPDLSLDFLASPEAPGSLGRLHQYDVIEALGHGGMGIVFRGRDSRLDRSVAIKVTSPILAFSPTARQRFIREAKAAAAVRHDHVVTIYDVGEVKGLLYLVMEHVAGDSLQQRIDRHGSLEVREILRIGIQTALGLAAAHELGLVHRDVKPANILLASNPDRVKISDFGLARSADDVSITQTGVIAGTPQYMAPEQALGEAVDCRADLFSLGSVLYAMCTGHSPYRASSAVAILRHVCEDQPQAIGELNPAVPSWLIAIVDKLHSKNPSDRFQSATEVADLLKQGLSHLEHPESAPPPRAPMLSMARRNGSGRVRRWPRAATAAGVLLVGLAMAEAAGVTHVAPAVMRLVFGEGVLVVEVDDPSIGVDVDGEALVITGAGPREVRIGPGRHRVAFSRDGKAIDEQFVTIARGGREVVRVTRERKPPVAQRDDSPWKNWPKDAPPPAIAPFDAAQASEHQEAWASYLSVPIEYVNSIGMKFRLIPPGEFVLGSSADEILALQQIARVSGWQDWEIQELVPEAPQRITSIQRPFYLATCEATVAAFRQFVDATKYVTSGERSGDGGWSHHEGQWVRRPEHLWKSPGPWQLLDEQPVVQISLRDAESFCRWLSEREGINYALPDVHQWEMAARAGTAKLYGASDDSESVLDFAWTRMNLPPQQAERPQPVGLKQGNPFGLYDMLGNVWEMCGSSNAPDGGGQPTGRGGAWMNYVIRSRPASSASFITDPDMAVDAGWGFRVAIIGDLVDVRKQVERLAGDSVAKSTSGAKEEKGSRPTSNNQGETDE